jgi:hypothetical protein
LNLDFLTPQLFDALVIVVIVAGVIWAALRIRRDFRRGPRWPEDDAPTVTNGKTPRKGQDQP